MGIQLNRSGANCHHDIRGAPESDQWRAHVWAHARTPGHSVLLRRTQRGVGGGVSVGGAMLLRRNMSQKLGALLLLFGLVWGLMLMRYTLQRPAHQTSAQLRQQILQLSHRYVKVLTEENRDAAGPQGTSMAGYADLKRTIAVLLDDILQRLVKLEGKIDAAVNGSLTNVTHPAGGLPLPAALHRRQTQDAHPRHPESHRPASATPHRRPEMARRPAEGR
ncbi:hypothetical protein AGOR_G00045260 [Albula goreensis]|uniref:MGT5A-like N-terminal domain-containing protein n=1 Tax=Albula goreensis TaxID=1534307 RepID=A0A8T3E2K6_9TELE|nr:hypothetical protein AGOR_G00045260 [Albula goreensis]